MDLCYEIRISHSSTFPTFYEMNLIDKKEKFTAETRKTMDSTKIDFCTNSHSKIVLPGTDV